MKKVLPDHYTGEIDSMNEAHFEFMYNKYYSYICCFAYKLLGQNEEVDDVICDVFVKFNQSKKIFPSVSTAKSYIFTSIKNKCFDVKGVNATRKKTIDQFQDLYSPETEDYIRERESESDHEYGLCETILCIAEKKLSSSRSKMFALRLIEGLTPEQVCEKTGLQYRTVVNKLSEAVAQLKNICQNDKDLVEQYRQYKYSH